MGVIKRQGIKKTVVDYVGVSIGMLSVFFVYPLVLEAYGLITFLRSTALLVAAFSTLGLDAISIRFFPVFRDGTGRNNGFLTYLFLAAIVAFVPVLLGFLYFRDDIIGYYQSLGAEREWMLTYLDIILPLALLLIFTKILIAFTSNLQRIVVPSILSDFFLKIWLPLILLLLLWGYIQLSQVIWLYFAAHLFTVVALCVYLLVLKQFVIAWPSKLVWRNNRAIARFAGYNILGNIGAALTQQLDVFMLGNMSSLKTTGTYDLGLRLTSPLQVPQRAMIGITGPLIAEAIKKDDNVYLKDIYQRSALNLSLFSLILFLLLYFNLSDVAALLPGGAVFADLNPVVLVIGLGILFDMSLSVNGHFITYSKHYRFNVLFIFCLGIANIGLNLLLIPKFGMVGAALATSLSLIGFNCLKLFFIYYHYRFWPFNRTLLKFILVAAITVAFIAALPASDYPILNIAYRSILTLTLYAGLLWKLKVSPDLNELIVTFIQRWF